MPSETLAPARILVTGSRNWSDVDAIAFALWCQYEQRFSGITVVHGAATRGADRIADLWCERFACPGIAVERHPADWTTHGKAAGLIRNQEMVDLGAEICLAFPLPESIGTVHCIERARRAGIRVIVHKPGDRSSFCNVSDRNPR